MLKIVKCAWENSDVSSSVQDFHRLHFEIVTSAAASTPKEVRAYLQRGSGPVSQAHLERGLRLDLFIYLLMYIICPYFVHSLIEFHFYAFYSSLSLKQAVVWRARMEKHNHGALWLIMDLHNSLWISTDDLWISIIELWASIIGFMEIHYSNYGAPYHSIYEDP